MARLSSEENLGFKASSHSLKNRGILCGRAKKSKEDCTYHNGHNAKRIEPAVLEYLGQFSNPDRVGELLKRSGGNEQERKKTELTKLDRRLKSLDSDFHKYLDYLKRGLLNEEEFSKANVERRDERATVEMQLAEICPVAQRGPMFYLRCGRG